MKNPENKGIVKLMWENYRGMIREARLPLLIGLFLRLQNECTAEVDLGPSDPNLIHQLLSYSDSQLRGGSGGGERFVGGNSLQLQNGWQKM